MVTLCPTLPITRHRSIRVILKEGHCDYDNISGNSKTYGKFWSWYAVHDSLNIASTSLHVPKDTEWRTPFKAERATVEMMIEM